MVHFSLSGALYCLMMFNIFRRLTIDSTLAINFTVFYSHARKAGLIITAVYGLLFCPWVFAQLIEHLQSQQVISLEIIYQQYTVQLWARVWLLCC